MNFKHKLMYTGLCLTILTCAAGVQSAISATGTELITVTVANPDPDIVLSGLTWTSGTFLAVNSKTTVATATVDAAGAVTSSPGSLGNARLLGTDTTGSAMTMTVGGVTAGAPSAAMNMKIADNTTGLATINVTDGVPTDAPFTITNFTAGTATVGTQTSFTSATGLGVITLDSAGLFTNTYGATLSTVKDTLPKPYSNGTYTGTVKVTLSY